MNAQTYLARISYSGPATADADTLRRLHGAHLMSVPFENLDIHLKRKIVIDEKAFLRKIIEEKRGGFCYELNGAFASLLRALGFQVALLAARVPRDDGSPGIEFDHLALRVDLEEPWLADVGFGDSFVEPLLLRTGIEQAQYGRVFRILNEEDELRVQRQHADGSWKNEYTFTPTPRRLDDFAGACLYHQTSPESPFTRKRICSMATPNGRITLADMKLIITNDGNKQERVLQSEEEWTAVLKLYFDVTLVRKGSE
jgi:N-hydroxyarylamine O-acetyltransferase